VAEIEEGSLGCAARRAILRRGREDRAAPLGMTSAGEAGAFVRNDGDAMCSIPLMYVS